MGPKYEDEQPPAEIRGGDRPSDYIEDEDWDIMPWDVDYIEGENDDPSPA